MLYEAILDALNGIFPDYETGEDNEGQLIVYTGLRVGKDDRMVPFNSDEEPENVHPQQDRDPVDSSTTEYDRVTFPSDEIEKLVVFPDSNIVEDVPKWLYFELLDRAAEEQITAIEDPDPIHIGRRDAAFDAFESVSSNDGEPAINVVLRRALGMARQAGK